MDQHATWYGGRPRPKRHCVRWGPSFLPKGHSPQFLAHVSCGQTAGWIKMPLGMEVDLCSGDIVLDGTELPPKRGRAPQFSAHVYCGQTAGCISIPFGTEVGLGPGDIVLDGDPAAPKKGHSPPIFSPCLLWPNCWMDQDATWYGSRPRPRQLSVGWGSSSPRKGHGLQFSAHVYCGQRSPISATAELLLWLDKYWDF